MGSVDKREQNKKRIVKARKVEKKE